MYDYNRMSEIERAAMERTVEQLANWNINYYVPFTPINTNRKKRKEQKHNERKHHVFESV